MTPEATLVISAIGGTLAGLLALSLVLWLAPTPTNRLRNFRPEALSEPRQFRFHNGYLVDHSDNIGFLLPDPIDLMTAWADLQDTLEEIADDVPRAFTALRERGRGFTLTGKIARERVSIVGAPQGKDLIITIASGDAEQPAVRLDQSTLAALDAERDILARAADTNQTLSWVTDRDGQIVWANTAYSEMIEVCEGADAAKGWPFYPLFRDMSDSPAGLSRRKLIDRRGQDRWFEVRVTQADREGHRHAHAVSVDPIIAAESALRIFTQTMTRTFAYLPTGLAVFDRDRCLAMFNPALMDMTGLDAVFLSSRPHLWDFFDALRDRRQLPEPRDYKAWRDSLSDLNRAGDGGTYRETWSLAGGQTYSVVGRPNEDGSVALMFEDISADVSATRTQREERDAMSSAMDFLDDAMLVFAHDGRRISSNRAASLLAGLQADDPMPEDIDQCIALLSKRFRPSPAWGDLRSFARQDNAVSGSADWTEILHLKDGATAELRVHRVAGGGLSVSVTLLSRSFNAMDIRAEASASSVA